MWITTWGLNGIQFKPFDGISPTVESTHPVQIPPDDILPPTRKYDVGECVVPDDQIAFRESCISAAPLLALKSDQFKRLHPPVVQNLKHLWTLRHQLLQSADRLAILANQQVIEADDEFRHHLAALVQLHVQHQCKYSDAKIKTCTVQSLIRC